MNSLATDIRQLIATRIHAAPASEILAIASNLCASEILPALEPIKFELQERFLVTGDTVADRSTGLTWSRTNVPGGRMGWSKAKQVCAALELGGFKDWRLPTVKDLLTLVDYERHEPAINPVFQCDAASYWTATHAACSPADCAWCVGFDGGGSAWDRQDYECFVRAVRPSQ